MPFHTRDLKLLPSLNSCKCQIEYRFFHQHMKNETIYIKTHTLKLFSWPQGLNSELMKPECFHFVNSGWGEGK